MNHKPTGPLGILGDNNPDPGALLTGRPNAIVDLDGFDIDSGTFQWLRNGVEMIDPDSINNPDRVWL